jgi:small GTP-binding protein
LYFDKKKLKALLQWFNQEVGEELIAALVVDRTGLIVDFITKIPEKAGEKKFIGAFSALADLILKKITTDFDLGTFGAGTFDTDQYRFIFCEAGPELVFVVVLGALVAIDPFFSYVFIGAEKIARIFDGRPVSPVIPKIKTNIGVQRIDRKIDTLQKIKLYSDSFVCKLSLIGDGGVGKTSIIQRYVHNLFEADYKATIGTDITKKECHFESLSKSTVRFIIWDIAGQPQFKRIRPAYLADSGAIIVVYDVANRESFENVKKEWYDDIKNVGSGDTLVILIGNKIDLDKRLVSFGEGEKLAQQLGMTYIETSAKTGENIEDIFRMIGLKIIERFVEAEEVSKIIVGKNKYMVTDEQLNILLTYIRKQRDFCINESDILEFDKCINIIEEIKKNKLDN